MSSFRGVAYAVRFLTEGGDLETKSILLPFSLGFAYTTPSELENVREVHLDRELRRLARELQRDLRRTITRVASMGGWSSARTLIHRMIERTRPRISCRSKGLWRQMHLGDFLKAHDDTTMLLRVSVLLGRIKMDPNADLALTEVYWEVPEFDPAKQKRKRSKA